MLKIFVIAAFVAVSANAAFIWQDDYNTAALRVPRSVFPFFQFPMFPPFKIPSPEDITKNTDPNFTGVSITSTSSGGTLIVTNKGGDIKKYKLGENGDPNTSTVLAALTK